MLASGYDSGAWDGPGINSSATGDYPGSSLGWADNASLGLSTFDGESVGNAILVKFTLGGDANLDGSVDFSDLSIVSGNYGDPGNWAQGDFNYDGVVNFDDLTILSANYGNPLSLTPLIKFISSDADLSAAQKAALLSVVPEPSSLVAIMLGLPVLARRKRRK